MPNVSWHPVVWWNTKPLQQACAVHQKASLLGSWIVVWSGYFFNSGDCVYWEWKMQGSDLRCCIGQIMKVKSNRSYFTIFLYLQIIKQVNISYCYKQVFWLLNILFHHFPIGMHKWTRLTHFGNVQCFNCESNLQIFKADVCRTNHELVFFLWSSLAYCRIISNIM